MPDTLALTVNDAESASGGDGSTNDPGDTAAVNDPVHHPSHYTSHPSGIECIEVSRLLGFCLGNAVKYVWRRGDKGAPAQDLDKSLFYLDNDAAHLPTKSQTGIWRRIAAAARYVRSGVGTPLVDRGRFTPPAAAELLLCVADHEPDPVAADFYRAIAAMDWDSARRVVVELRSAFPA